MEDIRSRLGRALGERYRIERELGQGGMGLVFQARELKHGRQVALKVLRPEIAQSLGGERFLREIRITAQLSHPNILTLIDSGEAGGFMYYVLPYVEGESLRARLDRERQLPLDEALRITREVADALSYAHSQGVVHRDIKPENILFEAGHAVVADFGIAKAVSEAGGDRLTESGLAVGTPSYMSPEQATGVAQVDARSDIYSLACVLYEMLAGAPPYAGPSAQAIIARKALEPVPGIRVVRDTVPLAVERAVMKALQKVPADRFATAQQFTEALSGVGTAAAPPSRMLSLTRSRVVAAASVIVVLAAASYLVLALRGSGGGPGVAALNFLRVTTDPGTEWFPSFSPDGKWLVYSGEPAGNRDIYLLGVGAQNPINLTADSPDNDDQPSFSPDGEQIAFRSEREGGGIFVMGRTGEAVRRVTSFGYRPTWSPDGARLAFTTENVDLNPQNSEGKSQLWIADVRTGATRRIQVADATMPAWSPNGKRIAYFERLGPVAHGHVWTVPAEGGEPIAVTSGGTRNWSPAWSRDGRDLYFVSDRGGAMNLWRIRINQESGRTTGDPEPITTPATALAHPSVAATGRLLAYSSVLVTTNIQRAGFDPARGAVVGEPEWLTRGSQRWANPDPSPDGQQVVFYSLVDPEGHLYVTRADGSGRPRELTGDTASDRIPRWSPDGKWIAMFSDRSGPLQIWKIRPDGSGLAQVTDAPENVAYAVWSPDANRMLAASTAGTGRRVTYLFDPNRGWRDQLVETLPTPPETMDGFGPHAWSPDGKQVAGQIGAADKGIVLYTFATRTYRRVTDYGQWPVWLPDSRRVLFVSGTRTFYLADVETGQVKPVFSVTHDVIGPPEITRDGRTIYFSRRVTEADIWLLTLP